MSKKMLKGAKIIVTLFTVLLLLSVPTLSSAVSRSNTNNFSAYADALQNRYTSISEYQNYLGDLNSFMQRIDTKADVNDTKIRIMDELEKLQDKYTNSTVLPNISTQLINQTINSSSTTTSDLLSTLLETVKNLLGNLNLAIESLTPDEVCEITATTAGKECGTDFKVKLVGKIYYANRTSNKWALLVNGSNMSGQAMADAIGEMYLDQDYNILAIDSRGNGDSEGSIAMGYVESLDVWDWLTFLNGNYNCNQIILHGISLGAATTVFASGLESNGKTLKDQHVIGLVEDCGYTSLTGIIKGLLGLESNNSNSNNSSEVNLKGFGIEDKIDLSNLSTDSLTDDVIKKLLIEQLGVGLTEENFDQKQNALNSLAKCDLPILIIHGTSDTIVPFENSDAIYKTAMENPNIPYVQRYTVEGGQHASIVLGTKYNVYEGHVENFIKKAEEIATGKTVDKQSNYQEEEEKKPSFMQSLVKALKLIKNLLNL